MSSPPRNIAVSLTRVWRTGFLLAGLMCLAMASTLQPASATVFEARNFPDETARVRYHALIEELRCLVCQNQNIADSDADLAADLRKKVFDLIIDGRTDTEIVDFMVQRYGDFVMYRPPVKGVTLALWLGPMLLLAAGLFVLYRQITRQRDSATATLTADEQQALSQAVRAENQETPR